VVLESIQPFTSGECSRVTYSLEALCGQPVVGDLIPPAGILIRSNPVIGHESRGSKVTNKRLNR
jgi:hypothetical protein